MNRNTLNALKEMRQIVTTHIEEMKTDNGDNGSAPPYLSVSRLGTYLGCGEKYRLKYLANAPSEPQGAFLGGRASHSTIQWCENQNIPQRLADATGFEESAIRNMVTNHFHWEFGEVLDEIGGAENARWGGRKTKEFPDGENHLWWGKVGPMMMRRYLALRLDDIKFGYQPIDGGIEMDVMVTMPTGMLLRGIIDAALLVDADGVPIIRDYKTGSWQSDPMQLATYGWLIGQARGIHPVHGEYAYLRTGADRGMPKVTPFELEAFSALVPDIYARLERGIAAGVFTLNPGPFCKSCSVRSACSYGSLLDGVDG